MPNFENAFSTVCELVKDFKENEHRYLSPQYQEAEVRRDFIDKLFEALGWDVYHRTQKNPFEQEVKVEKGVSVGKAQKRADYAFYINPEFRQPKFFVEAKKPSRSLKNADDYFQTVRYGWNSNTPIAVLTDFEEFHVLDCRPKPNLKTVLDNPNHKSYLYTDYANEEVFREIFHLFSREEVANSSLTKYSDSFVKVKGKGKGKDSYKGTIKSIDDDFLEYIDEVRETLAKAFKKNDSKLSSEELTEATQRTIDRIVFIRFLEDKLIEPEYYISEFGKKGNAWNEFISVCRKLDAKYNGIVFKKHFIDEQNFQGPEQNTFKKICDEMSYLNSPYDFNAIPIHILGSIYERFLGKVVNATAQRVKVEEKPEVRKAGGVYYTPKYIVDYIVDNTVGKIIRNEESNASIPACEKDKSNNLEDCLTLPLGKTPAEISKLRFADIACGSGSFLIGVFETLLKYHTEYYQLHPEQAKKDGCINKDGLWILSIKQKQNILLNNIYGVDIDNQAVEVTQLSLALKMLEDETGGTANDMQNMFHEKILPDLSKNIICGNSLIGTDILQGKIFPTEEERKLNPMDFETTFPQVFCHSRESGNPDNNGFDAIVGNPPYGAELYDIEYLSKYYKYSTLMKEVNSFVYFIERSTSLLRKDGILGYIIPDTLLLKSQYENFRKFLYERITITEIIETGTVFSQAKATPNIVLFLKNSLPNSNSCYIRRQINPNQKIENILEDFHHRNWLFDGILSYKDWKQYYSLQIGRYINNEKISIIDKILNNTNNCKLKDIEELCIDRGLEGGKSALNTTLPQNGLKILIPDNIDKYFVSDIPNYYTDESKDSFNYDRILIIRIRNTKISKRIVAAFETKGTATLKTLQQIYIKNQSTINLKYILAFLNSRITNFICNHFLVDDINKEYLLNLIIPRINSEERKHSHYKIVSLVDQMLESKKQLQASKTDKDKTYWERKCEQLDRAIDSEVYKLYGLTEDEIRIVEGK